MLRNIPPESLIIQTQAVELGGFSNLCSSTSRSADAWMFAIHEVLTSALARVQVATFIVTMKFLFIFYLLLASPFSTL